MRIIAGEFRSRRLEAPRGMETRPTSDRLRETLFNVLAPRLLGARFLDLYAGSGANGLEALSRGAREAVLVENAAPAVAAMRTNIAALGVAGQVRVESLAVARWLDGMGRSGKLGAFAVVFLDPPYDAADEYEGALTRLGGAAAGLVAEGGVVVAEYRRLRPGKPLRAAESPAFVPAERYGTLRKIRTLEQGDAALAFFAAE